jgi:hypothetical protein
LPEQAGNERPATTNEIETKLANDVLMRVS